MEGSTDSANTNVSSPNIYELLSNTQYDPYAVQSRAFILYPHQVIPKYYILSNDNVRNLILHYSLGSGKTSAAVFALLYNLDIYRMYKFNQTYAPNKLFLERNVINRNIYVIGAWQTQAQVLNELMRPEFGVITERQFSIISNHLNSPSSIEREKGLTLRAKFMNDLTKEISFMGYQKFFDEVFEGNSSQFIQNSSALINAYEKGDIKLRVEFIKRLKNAIIIVDEMQHLYSNIGLNSYGFTLAIVSRLAEKYNVKIIYLSGTMLNSSLAEVADVMSILTNKFYTHEDITYPVEVLGGISIAKLKPEVLPSIEQVFAPSFIYYNQSARSSNEAPELLPVNKLPSTTYAYTHDDETQFIERYSLKCKASNDKSKTSSFKAIVYPKKPLLPTEIHIGNHIIEDVTSKQPMLVYSVTTAGSQQSAYEQFIKRNIRSYDLDEEAQTSSISIHDAFVGRAESGVNISRTADGIFTGNFMDLEHIGNYSALGREIFFICLANILQKEKTVIYHNKLTSFGIMQYMRILVYNGFVNYGTTPVSKSLCRHCGHAMSDHSLSVEKRQKARICNNFEPIFIDSLHGERSTLERDKLTRLFNAPTNLYGSDIAVLFVSDVAYSGVSFFNTNNVIVLSRVNSISKWKQIYSRIIRTRSHQMLPDTKQYAKVYTMVIELPDETKRIPDLGGITYEDKYYKLRSLLNIDIEEFTLDIANKCVGNKLLNNPSQYVMSDVEVRKTRDLFRLDVEREIKLMVRRVLGNDSGTSVWHIDSLVKRLKDPSLAVTYLNLSRNNDNDIKLLLYRMKELHMFNYGDDTQNVYVRWKHESASDIVRTNPELKFELFENITFRTNSIAALINTLSGETAISNKLSLLSKILKLAKHKYEILRDKEEFWNTMYDIGNEYYADDEDNFFHNHMLKNRIRSAMAGCYYGNEIILKDGTAKHINLSYPISKPLHGLPFMFRIMSTALSDSSPFYLHVSVVKMNEGEVTDKRKQYNKGIVCMSMNVSVLYPYFKNITRTDKKKNYCRALLHEVCALQCANPETKFVYSPFEG